MNTLLSKYKDYKIENEDACKDMPGSKILSGILQKETIQTNQRVFGGSPWSDTPYELWMRVADATIDKHNNDNKTINQEVNMGLDQRAGYNDVDVYDWRKLARLQHYMHNVWLE